MPPPDDPLRAGENVPSAALRVLKPAHDAARERFGDLGLGLPDYAAAVCRCISRHRQRRGLATTADDLQHAVARRALDDLYLTAACDQGSEVAWRVLTTTYSPRIIGLARKRGAGEQDAESVTADLFADLALPSPSGETRTLLGTFAGAGSLWAWLAATLVRRLARPPRRVRAQETELHADEAGPDAPPWQEHVEDEVATELGAALDAAWGSLEDGERAALVLKHRRGMKQRRIGELLAVPEYQVSRWLARAVSKIRGAVERCDDLAGTDPNAGGLWERLTDVIENRLARLEGQAPLPGDTEGPKR